MMSTSGAIESRMVDMLFFPWPFKSAGDGQTALRWQPGHDGVPVGQRSGVAAHEARQIMGGHRGGWTVVALDLDQAGLRAAALAQLAGTDIKRERVGIAVLFQRPVLARVSRIKPCAGAQ